MGGCRHIKEQAPVRLSPDWGCFCTRRCDFFSPRRRYDSVFCTVLNVPLAFVPIA